MFGNLICWLHAPPGCWKSYLESSSLFMHCSPTSPPLPSTVPSSLAHHLTVKCSHQQELVISLCVGPIPQLTETEENYTELGQICKFKPPSFVSSNGTSSSWHSLKEGNTMWFPETGGTGASDPGGPIPSHALLFFPCSLFAATHLNLGCKLILTVRGMGLSLLSVWHTVGAG